MGNKVLLWALGSSYVVDWSYELLAWYFMTWKKKLKRSETWSGIMLKIAKGSRLGKCLDRLQGIAVVLVFIWDEILIQSLREREGKKKRMISI